VPLFPNEFSCELVGIKMSLVCMKMNGFITTRARRSDGAIGGEEES